MNYVFLYCLICICQNIVCSSLVEEIKNIIIIIIIIIIMTVIIRMGRVERKPDVVAFED